MLAKKLPKNSKISAALAATHFLLVSRNFTFVLLFRFFLFLFFLFSGVNEKHFKTTVSRLSLVYLIKFWQILGM